MCMMSPFWCVLPFIQTNKYEKLLRLDLLVEWLSEQTSSKLQVCIPHQQDNSSMPLSLNSSSSLASSLALVPRSPFTTCAAHWKYSWTRCSVQPSGDALFKSRRLYSLSASFTSLAPLLRCGACSICSRLRSSFSKDLSSVTSATKPTNVVFGSDGHSGCCKACDIIRSIQKTEEKIFYSTCSHEVCTCNVFPKVILDLLKSSVRVLYCIVQECSLG